MGQLVRGGRSCTSETKLGAGADSAASLAAARSSGATSAEAALTSGVSEQYAEHRLHLSEPAS